MVGTATLNIFRVVIASLVVRPHGMSVCLSVCLSVGLSVCLAVCLSKAQNTHGHTDEIDTVNTHNSVLFSATLYQCA